MLYAFLLFGTPWFWAALIIPYIILTAFVENERSGWALATVVITAGLWITFGHKGIVPWIIAHPSNIAMYLGGYVALGIIWGFVKWFFYVLRARDKYAKFRAEWVARYGEIDDTPMYIGKTASESKRVVFLREVKSDNLAPPTADKNKGRIVFWMSYWPASAIWTLLNDPLRHLWNFIYARLGALFERISKSMFSKYNEDFVLPSKD